MAKIRQQTLLKVKDYMERQWKRLAPEVTAEQLCDNAAIYYMNGNDGTDFDWSCNGRVCEFYYFYKDGDQMGFIKAYVRRNGDIDGYLYKELGHGEPIKLPTETVDPADAYNLRNWLMANRDKKNIWDKPIEF